MAKGTLSIQAFGSDDERMIAEGKLDLIDNTVDANTGTVKLKAEFANADRALWPGQFVNAHAVLSVAHDGVTVPSDAVLTGPKGAFTYVVGPDSKVSLRPLKILQTENNVALIGAGLQMGETVVTIGQFRLQPGATVKISDQMASGGQRLSDAPAGTDSSQ